jgi:hypothetical protein
LAEAWRGDPFQTFQRFVTFKVFDGSMVQGFKSSRLGGEEDVGVFRRIKEKG